MAVTLPLVIEFSSDDVLYQGYRGGEFGLGIPRRLLASTADSWFGPDFLVLFHDIVSFYYLIIVALSLFMSFFRTTIGVACCPVWKGLSILDDFIYVSCF